MGGGESSFPADVGSHGCRAAGNYQPNPSRSLRIFRGYIRENGVKLIRYRTFLGTIFSLIIFISLAAAGKSSPSTLAVPIWGKKPLLSYFILTPGLQADLKGQLSLSPVEWSRVEEIAQDEFYQLSLLEDKTGPIVKDPARPLWVKRLLIKWMGYNRQVDAIVMATERDLREALDDSSYRNLVNWIEQRWLEEVRVHGRPEINILPSSRSFQVYATRYDSGGAYYVALPDKCVKFTNGGSSICAEEGYLTGQRYSVYLSYQGSTGAVVGESGPWNVDDTYWAGWNDPTPRRMFADLPLGMPEAQAAYFNGYNGGLDQFGRKVTGPFGIDLARQVSIDIGLQPGTNDWITVSFLWTEGWDTQAGAATAVPGAPEATSAPAVAIAPIQLASPMPDGSVVHVVEYGQSLWQIAVAYHTTIQSILQLNELSSEAVIWPGDELVVLPAGSLTPDPAQTSKPVETQATQTSDPRSSTENPGTDSSTATTVPATLPPETGTGTPAAEPTHAPIFTSVLVVGLGLVLLGLGLVGASRLFFK